MLASPGLLRTGGTEVDLADVGAKGEGRLAAGGKRRFLGVGTHLAALLSSCSPPLDHTLLALCMTAKIVMPTSHRSMQPTVFHCISRFQLRGLKTNLREPPRSAFRSTCLA